MHVLLGISHGDTHDIRRLVDAFIAREGLEHPLCESLDELVDIGLCLSRPVGAAVMPISPGVSHGDMRSIHRLG